MTTPPDPLSSELEQEPGGKMSFFEHLVDLRKRLINSAIAIAIGAMIGVSISEKVFGFIARPMQEALRKQHQADRLIYTSPAGMINLIITLRALHWAGHRRSLRPCTRFGFSSRRDFTSTNAKPPPPSSLPPSFYF
jgi:hypothetical protein